MKVLRAGQRPSGLHLALGMGRLQALRPRSGTPVPTLATVRALDKAALRNVIRAMLMVTAALLGFWGFQAAVLPPQSAWEASVIWNNMFRTLQLLTTQFPSNFPAELPLQLQIARFAMPLFAVWFTATALLRRFNRPLLAWMAGLSRNHIVLVGTSELSLALARAYRRLGRNVLAISAPLAGDIPSPMERAGARLVFGDPADQRTLRRSGLARASAVIAADDVGPMAVALAGAVAEANEGRGVDERPLTLLIRLAHRELRALMATQIAAALRHSRVELKLYVRERAIARSLIGRYPPDWGQAPGPQDIHAAIIGFGDLGAEILLQLARVAVPLPGRRTILTVVDRDADGLREQLLAEHPGLANCGELRFIQAEVRPSAIKAEEVEAWLMAPVPATSVYVCSSDDHVDLSMAIGLRRAYARLRVVPPPFFVHQQAGTTLIDALPRMHSRQFDTLRIVPFGGIEQEADPFYLVDEESDDLARLMHEEYVRNREKTAADAGTPLPAVPAAAPWPELSDTYRTANRSQADDVLMKLRILGFHAIPQPRTDNIAIDTAVLEALAEREHERWCRDRWLDGWTYAPTRDDALLHHPNLVPYDQLSEPIRDLDRDTIRNVPGLLRKFGVGLSPDRRIGIWFLDKGADPAPELMAQVVAKAEGCIAGDHAHLQLVLPLRSMAEFALVSSLGKGNSLGADVALLIERGERLQVGSVDLQRARDLITASDRAFVLRGSEEGQDADADADAGLFVAFCDVCNHVILVAETAAAMSKFFNQIDEPWKARVVCISLRT
ncbi:RyR domain-containing protein [Enhydrobacter aerosaccus]|uniref:RyR domain-containing protein n=1 Tax=Enhydrobacter aerosaccus TaxID=225324 RepID=A0A1T4S0J8_9HYPH|nr:RyR domain-containing protein [Enhydrobacter aerosaccus]SKA21697.1 RyR domain-containing protein [Enhydrobacter aerosaccus]